MVKQMKKKKRVELFDVINLTLLTLLCLTTLYPSMNLLFTSVSKQADVTAAGRLLLYPQSIQFFLCQVGTKKFLRIYKQFIGGQPPVNGLRFLYALVPFFVRRFLCAASNAFIIGVTGNSLSDLDRNSNRMSFSLNLRSNLMKEETSRLIREVSRVRIVLMS